MKKRNLSRSGFTLIELLLVLVILAVLAGVATKSLMNRSRQARDTAAKLTLKELEGAVKMFENDTGRLPTTEEGLNALMTAPEGVINWRGPYMEKGIPKDPWGGDYSYRQPGEGASSFDLVSLGADQRPSDDDIKR